MNNETECAARRNDWRRYPPRKARRGISPKLRRVVLAEEPQCTCGAPSEEVDHVLAVSLGGSDDRENLQGICRRCHLSKSGREANLIRWTARRQRPRTVRRG